jgi:hypothetical protein
LFKKNKNESVVLSFSFEQCKEHNAINNYSDAYQNLFRDIKFHPQI